MSDEYIYVCSDCGRELVRVEHPDNPGIVTFECPTHGQRAFFLDGGTINLGDAPTAAE